MADPDPSRPDLLARVEQTRAQSHTLRAQVAELAEAVAKVELDVARVQEGIAELIVKLTQPLGATAGADHFPAAAGKLPRRGAPEAGGRSSDRPNGRL